MAFVRKVYAILSAQLGLTTIVAAFCMYNASVKAFVQSNETLLYLLAAFTLVEAYTVGVVCAFNNREIVLQATILTFCIFIGLTMFTLQSKMQFEGMQPFLFTSLVCLLFAPLSQLFFPYSHVLDLVYTIGGGLLFCGFIVFDTFMMFEKYTVDEYILAAVELYLDILNLFLRILKLLSNNND
ncbi:hypothetical protein BCR33DRAFT_715203 [Rhizoclosmatium globosum]|uniref:Uncharacterized protein n=1 Tax=Rhizoclosmatium globosum TaxID=329046 RepID=A0A1Y2CIN0_9FUNG|nr:hypothetical protein BCR33DRAFT_715203 [Rhizoclosmatium globosum]|eukprot:ORY46757.1 hypothetical protein BCR33DRAFT_715203 [Rhizoclosmatium globosum]